MIKITVNIEAGSAAEIREALTKILNEETVAEDKPAKKEKKTAEAPIGAAATIAPPAPAEDKPKVTIEQVRAKLAELSNRGKQAQVKELISKFGAAKLTEIPSERYAEVLATAEGL